MLLIVTILNITKLSGLSIVVGLFYYYPGWFLVGVIIPTTPSGLLYYYP